MRTRKAHVPVKKCRTCDRSVAGSFLQCVYCRQSDREAKKIRLANINHVKTYIDINKITMDPEMQLREKIHQGLITQYASAMRQKDSFPPVEIVYEGGTHWLVDGWHRVLAAKKIGETEIRANKTRGTRRQALIAAACANNKHGLQRTRKEIRRAVSILLMDLEWVQGSDQEIAKKAGVHKRVISRQRARMENAGQIAHTSRRLTAPVPSALPDTADLKQLRAEGMTVRQIADQYGVTVSHVYARLRANYIAPDNRRCPAPKQADANLRRNTPEIDAINAIKLWRRLNRTNEHITQIIACLTKMYLDDK